MSGLSGQHEQLDGPERSGQPEQLDATLIMARPSGRSGSPGAGGHRSEGPPAARQHSSRSVFEPIPAADRRPGAADAASIGDRAPGPTRNGASALATSSAEAGTAEEDRTPAEATRTPAEATRTRAEPARTPAADMRPERNGVPHAEKASDPEIEQPAAVQVLPPAAEPALVPEIPGPRWTPSAVNGSAGRGPDDSGADPAPRHADQPARHVDTPARQVDQPGPEAGSWADLRQRLERLPYGHPSSPYHVDGEREPPPPRLVHLELA
ncbi:MAG TPA: hypothetical protein VF506_00645, partial [Streptosporangiaceae bacterium]